MNMTGSMSTDAKIKELKKRLPDADDEVLLELLVTCHGNINKALGIMGVPVDGNDGDRGDQRTPADNNDNENDVKVQSTLLRYRDSENSDQPKAKKLRRLSVKGEVIHVYSPSQLRELDVPCTMTMNFLPKKLANDLAVFLLKESQNWSQTQFYLFERLVASHHTHALYSVKPRASMSYYGREITDALPFNDLMTQARDLVQERVNSEILNRGPTKFQAANKIPWISETVIANLYKDKSESVGYHSDQLTHLGPDAVIASLTLGVTREFRLASRHDPGNNSVISIHIPHNCLVVMHATCQERFKHAIVPASTASYPHPITGQSRLNLTFRMYPEEFDKDKLPLCDCKIPMILRTTKDEDYKYIWQCAAGYSNRDGCGKLLYPDFTRKDPLGLKT